MTNEQIIEMAKQAGMEVHPRKMQIRVGADAALGLDSTAVVTRFAQLVRNEAFEECANVCDEMHEHYTGLKDTALLNRDVELSNAMSGEPRACEFIAKQIRSLKS